MKLVIAGTEEIFLNDNDRNYEFSGIQGRHFYTYTIDSANQVIALQNRNPNHADDKLSLHYERSGDRIVLTGKSNQSDSLHVILDKVDRKYILEEAKKVGRRNSLKL